MENTQPTLPTLAAFDFDGTLTQRDSFLPFLQMVAGSRQFFWGLLALSPVLLGHALGLVPNWRAKQAFLTYFLAGTSEADLQAWGRQFAATSIPQLLRPEAVDRLRWHQQQGHTTVLVSASMEAYLRPWAIAMGFDRVIGTQLEVRAGVVTGKLAGKNCYGTEKVRRLRELLGDLTPYYIYAYGDSKGDRELLAAADRSYYRTFGDASSDAFGELEPGEVEPGDRQPVSEAFPRAALPPQWERGLLLSVAGAAILYLAIVLVSGAESFWAALQLLPGWLIPAMLGIVFVGYLLRFGRWQWYLRRLGYRVPLAASLRLFLAGFALTASPGKAGESIKSILLKREWDIPIAPTLAALFCERFTDALSVVLLICLSAFSGIQGQWAIASVGIFQLGVILMLQRPQFVRQRLLHPLHPLPLVGVIAKKLTALLDSTSLLLEPRLLAGSTLLALVAWGLEGIVLYVLFQYLGAESITPYQAILIHTASGLLGAISFLPGGIGSTEVLTISLSVLYGASQTVAIAATFLIRLLTLWFAVAIGIVALLASQHQSRLTRTSKL